MSVKIRMKRMGSKRNPFYRLVVADSRAPRDGRIIEQVGTYNPVAEPVEINVEEESIMKWLHEGAKPSDTVHKLLSSKGIMERFHNEKYNNK